MGAQQGRERAHVSLDKEGGDGVVESSSIRFFFERNVCLCYRFGYSSCQGWRKEMEDAHTCIGNIAEFPDCSFFGVFDGHGGVGAANYVSTNLLPKIVQLASVGRDAALAAEPAIGGLLPPEKIGESISSAFIETDTWMAENMKQYIQKGDSEDPGSTAVTAFISPTHYFFAHLGDARYDGPI